MDTARHRRPRARLASAGIRTASHRRGQPGSNACARGGRCCPTASRRPRSWRDGPLRAARAPSRAHWSRRTRRGQEYQTRAGRWPCGSGLQRHPHQSPAFGAPCHWAAARLRASAGSTLPRTGCSRTTSTLHTGARRRGYGPTATAQCPHPAKGRTTGGPSFKQAGTCTSDAARAVGPRSCELHVH